MSTQIISTISDRCKRCYSCIRECPAKAIRVLNGQAVILAERCISCGHCVKVCSQHAKKIESDVEKVLYNLIPTANAVAIVAPAFAASFPDLYKKIPTALRKVGFLKVSETAFGADLVSQEYSKIFEANKNETLISSPCPAVYNFIEKYYPELVPNLAKIVSPMVAMGRYLKNEDKNIKIVFIGPCTAKKFEQTDPEVENAIDAVLTFIELKEIFNKLNINLDELEDSEFDPPHSNLGKTFPLAGGLLKTAGIGHDVLAKDIIVVDGKQKVVEIIEDIAEGKIKNKLIDILFCEGCINGPAIDSELNHYSKQDKVLEYIHDTNNHLDKHIWKSSIFNSRELDLKRNFIPKPERKPTPDSNKIKEILAKTGKINPKDELNCGACGYPTCREYAIAIAKGLAEEEMCLPYLINKLESALNELETTQDQLHSAEKLASIGQLAAGVAHEINNPLGSIMLYASMLKRESEKKGENPQSADDLKLIINEANRCKNIVSNLLNFARQGKLQKTDVDLIDLISDVIKSVKIKNTNSDINIILNNQSEKSIINADADQLKQVFLNLINNACESLEESELKYVNITIKNSDKYLIVEIIDTGCGIPEKNMSKLFTPFFTTKKIGKGTGLGLAISYGIIKMHKGKISVKSEENKGTVFKLELPFT